ncbi:MAG: AbrB/MazE/SpoVT family DNA-binding domain-containing protein [Acidobacteria bacterium]|nr:AbrB/MazE/SpoVT family DNA-binding domain-containing protein [Acidobacteriota bacterium]MBI3470081.1 AbrB/MazE/SpoVT family DNA-binding domain-containing protein [Candidatus Solibacter usitatus]
MAVTRVFRSGNSQAVRIPRGFRFSSGEVEIVRRGDEIILRERPPDLSRAVELLTSLSPGFFKGGRKQPKRQKRAKL